MKVKAWVVSAALGLGALGASASVFETHSESLTGADHSAGADLYERTCRYCHGTRAQGGLGPSLMGKALLEPRAFQETVKNGRGKMPAFGFLSDDQIEAIRRFLDAQRAEAQRRPKR
jgi:mono/diheme cytochrome c family protein